MKKFILYDPNSGKMFSYEDIKHLPIFSLNGFRKSCEYTTINDSDNTEIYEGHLFDVNIMGFGRVKDCKLVGEVVFRFARFMIKFISPDTGEPVYSDLYRFIREGNKKIIGHKFLNPELL